MHMKFFLCNPKSLVLKFKWSSGLFTPAANAKAIFDVAASQDKPKLASNVTILVLFAFDCAKCEGKVTFLGRRK